MAGCITCSSSAQCLTCGDGLPVNPYGNCERHLCSYGCMGCLNYTNCLACALGTLVIGGCSEVVGCIEVAQQYNVSAHCLACDPSRFVLDQSTGLCRCLQGNLVGEYCSELAGCAAVVEIGTFQ
jgi:hypothetical protein